MIGSLKKLSFKRWCYILIINFFLLPVLVSCKGNTPYESMAKNASLSTSISASGKIYSFVFEAANSGGEFSTDQTAIINEKEININIISTKDTSKIVPTILFCENSDCSAGKTADELGIHYKPRYRAADTSFYSCPAPIPGREYDKATGWFETAVTSGWCIKEDRNRIFKDPVTYTITTSDGATKEYLFKSSLVDGAAKEMLSLSFLKENNASLASDISKSISSTTVSMTLPFGTDVTALKPSFAITGSKVTLTTEGGSEIISSVTSVDFSSPVDLFVVEADGSGGQAYTVTLTTETPFSEFKLEAAKNAGLSKDYTGVIDHNLKTIDFTVDADDDATSVIPTIDLSSDSISVNPLPDSAQNFEASLNYAFTADSGSPVSYTINVSKQSSIDLSQYSIEVTKDGAVDATLDLSSINPFGLGNGMFKSGSFILVSRGYGSNTFQDWDADMTPDFSAASNVVYYFDSNSNFNGSSDDYVKIYKNTTEIDASAGVDHTDRLKLRQANGTYIEITDISDANYKHLFNEPISSISGYTEPLFIWAIAEDDVTGLFTDYGSNFFLIYVP